MSSITATAIGGLTLLAATTCIFRRVPTQSLSTSKALPNYWPAPLAGQRLFWPLLIQGLLCLALDQYRAKPG